MNLVVKFCTDNYFLSKLDDKVIAKDDFLLYRKIDNSEIINYFRKDRLITTENKALWFLYTGIIRNARQNRIRNIICITEIQPSAFHLILLLLLSWFCGASLHLNGKITSDKITTLFFLKLLPQSIPLPIYPIISIGLLPKFIYREVIMNFLLTKEPRDMPFIAIGNKGRLSGVTYWYSFTNRAKQNGLFGYAFNEYMGVPASLYNFPLSIYSLSKIRFRGTFILGLIMLCISIVKFNTNLSVLTLTLVFILYILSNILWEHASLGAYEILPWGFGALSIVSFFSGSIILSGALLGLAILSHLGVAFLIVFFLGTYSALNGLYLQLLLMGGISFIVSCYWFIAYFKNRKLMERTRIINKEWKYSYKFGTDRLIQFIVYLLFVCSIFQHSRDVRLTILALLPASIAYINAKLKWFLSPYTVRTFQFIVGIYCLAISFNIYSLLIFLYLIYLPPCLLSWSPHEDRFYYGLKPGSRQDLIAGSDLLFDKLKDTSRIGFEYGPGRAGTIAGALELTIFFCYYLSDKKIEFFNSGMIELIKYNLNKKTCANFNHTASETLLIESIKTSGVTHIVAYSDSFKKNLVEFGFKQKSSANLCVYEGNKYSPIEVALFEVPFSNERIIPHASISIGKNCLKLKIPQESAYFIKYSYHPGLICMQKGNKLKLKAFNEGMIIEHPEAGDATLYFSHYNLII